MDSLFATRDRLLAVLNEELGSEFRDLAPAFRAWRENVDRDAIGVCGFPCDGGCATCTQSAADLDAFFAPDAPAAPQASEASASVEGAGPSAAEESESEGSPATRVGTLAVTTEDQERNLENLRSQDAIDEMIRAGEAVEIQIMVSAGDEDDEEDDDCDCRECRLRRDPEELYVEERESSYYYNDGGYGLDWNESGYFD